MKDVERKKLRDITEKVNSIIKRIATNTIGETNRLIYAGARVIRAELGMESERNKHRKEPGWKTRLEMKLKEKRKDPSRLDEIFRGRYECHQYLLRKYNLDEKTVEEVKEMLKQSIIAVSAKIKRLPRTWIHGCLEMYKVDEKIRHMMRNSMETWRAVLECYGSEPGEVNIRKGIFQGDSLSPLLFVIAMIPLTSILRRATPGYVFKNKTKINQLLYMDDHHKITG